MSIQLPSSPNSDDAAGGGLPGGPGRVFDGSDGKRRERNRLLAHARLAATGLRLRISTDFVGRELNVRFRCLLVQ